jgi:hypothetical protein
MIDRQGVSKVVALWHLCLEGNMLHYWDKALKCVREGVPIHVGALKGIIA